MPQRHRALHGQDIITIQILPFPIHIHPIQGVITTVRIRSWCFQNIIAGNLINLGLWLWLKSPVG